MKTTIQAVANEDKGTPQSIFIFEVEHNCPYSEVVAAIKAAFSDWSVSNHGRRYLEANNGSNWGDATYIPPHFLHNQGITSINIVPFGNCIIVDHNQNLLGG